MPEYNEDQIKMALTAAKDLAAARNARRQDFTPRQADVSERSEIRANRRATENLLASSIAKAGFEVDKFDQLLAQNRSALRRIAERRKAEAVERSSSAKDTSATASRVDGRLWSTLQSLPHPNHPRSQPPSFMNY
jgi:hypothetical protein